jgi:hypothetical protein
MGLNSESGGDKQFDSVTTKDTSTETIAFDYGNDNPHFPRMPEGGAGLFLKPHPTADNPVVQASDVSNPPNTGFTDPFIVRDGATYHLFVERFDTDNHIDHFETLDFDTWTHNGTVVSDANRAWPQVFKFGGTWYMVPTNIDNGDIELLVADTFPSNWSVKETLISSPSGVSYNDPAIWRWKGVWYVAFKGDNANDNQLLYYSDSLVGGSWSQHPNSPIRNGNARMRTRPIVHEHYIDTFEQGDLTAYRITDLSKTSFNREKLSWGRKDLRLEGSGRNGTWNKDTIHHIDFVMPSNGQSPIAVVDGYSGSEWSVGMYTVTDQPPAAAKYYPTSDKSVASNDGTTKLSLDGVQWETADHQVSGRYVAPISGYYRISAQVTWRAPASGTPFQTRLTIANENGDSFGTDRKIVSANERTSQRLTATDYLSRADSVTMDVYQNSGSTLDTFAGSPELTYLEVEPVW